MHNFCTILFVKIKVGIKVHLLVDVSDLFFFKFLIEVNTAKSI